MASNSVTITATAGGRSGSETMRVDCWSPIPGCTVQPFGVGPRTVTGTISELMSDGTTHPMPNMLYYAWVSIPNVGGYSTGARWSDANGLFRIDSLRDGQVGVTVAVGAVEQPCMATASTLGQNATLNVTVVDPANPLPQMMTAAPAVTGTVYRLINKDQDAAGRRRRAVRIVGARPASRRDGHRFKRTLRTLQPAILLRNRQQSVRRNLCNSGGKPTLVQRLDHDHRFRARNGRHHRPMTRPCTAAACRTPSNFLPMTVVASNSESGDSITGFRDASRANVPTYRRINGRWLLLAVALWLGACASQDQPIVPGPPAPPPVSSAPFVVAPAASVATAEQDVYVSLPPDSIPTGVSATITNPTHRCPAPLS